MFGNSGFSLKKSIIKGIEVFVYGGVGALISYLTGLEQTQTVIATIAVLKVIQNILKNI